MTTTTTTASLQMLEAWQSTSSQHRTLLVVSAASTTRGPRESAGRMIPFAIPAAQRYYWTAMWQEDETANLADLEAGLKHSFANGADAAAWLLEDR